MDLKEFIIDLLLDATWMLNSFRMSLYRERFDVLSGRKFK